MISDRIILDIFTFDVFMWDIVYTVNFRSSGLFINNKLLFRWYSISLKKEHGPQRKISLYEISTYSFIIITTYKYSMYIQ